MFRKLLIANRGEIAVRVIKACREMGIATVAVYSDADARALHVLRADEAVRIGEPPASASYLNIAAILDAARLTGAEAVHPGYGFLSENAEFAEACMSAGLVWVGPPPAAMRAMGSKIEARRLAADLGVPLLPGYQGDTQDDEILAREAAVIGYPVLIKASAGGGGRGMRVVEAAESFSDALDSARRESKSAFGDDRVLLERYVRRPRHIEIQVVGDQHGHLVHLGERECSIQRRHQKVIEESPSTALTPALREEMGQAAVRLARAIDYVGAGTIEFLLDEQGRYAFLEMNTRLQVEHGVTELVTGLDLVQLQLRVAAGEPLPFAQEDVRFAGHAIECRVYAEDPANGFLPSIGRITTFAPPRAKDVRNDVGIEDDPGIAEDILLTDGGSVSPYYDALLAKLIVHGPDRHEAIRRTSHALERYRVEGVTTNLQLLRQTISHPAFATGETFTDFLDLHVLPTLEPPTPPAQALVDAALSDLLGGEADDPWRAGHWRPSGNEVTLMYRFEGALHSVTARHLATDDWEVSAVGETHRVHVARTAGGGLEVRTPLRRRSLHVSDLSGTIVVRGRGFGREIWLTRVVPPSVAETSRGGAAVGGPKTLTAPLTGVVVKVAAVAGDIVSARQPLVVLEAMKMEHTIEAPAAATVAAVRCQVGDWVQAGDVLVELAPPPSESGA